MIGYVLGRSARTSTDTRPRWWRDPQLLRPVVGLLLLALVAGGMTTTYGRLVQLDESVACQRRFNVDYRAALAAQLRAAQMEAAAQRELLTTLRPGAGAVTAQERDQALGRYIEFSLAADELRTRHPIPVLSPCGEQR